jgi:trk system potassium uptake protein TrkA
MRIVVVSSGPVAPPFVAELSREHDVVIVHDGDEARDDLAKFDVEVVFGAGTDSGILRSVGTGDASHFIAWTRSDEVNIIACLAARQLGSPHTICRLEKEEHVRTFGGTNGPTKSGGSDLGIDTIIWPARQLADKIEKILSVPGATDVGHFAQGQIHLLEYRLRGILPLVGRPLMELQSLPRGVLIVAVTRGDDWFVPRGGSVLEQGDRVLFMGRSGAMQALAAWFAEHLGEEHTGQIVIVGGGSVGLRLARSMERNRRARIKLIEQSADRCEEIADILARTLVLQGDGADLDLLESERVRDARALVAVTDSDEKNLLVSLLGRQLGIQKVVTRVTSSKNRRVFQRVGVDVPISARGAATEAVVHMIRHEEVDLLATIGGGQGEILELELPKTFKPLALSEITMPDDSLVAAIVREGKAIVPDGSTLVSGEDRCLIICRTERVQEVRKTLLR